MIKKCLDMYGLVEIAKGNKNFTAYFTEDFVITELTLAEFYAVILREEGEKTAEYWFKRLQLYAVSVDKRTLIEAVKFRYTHLQNNISFFDAVGYIFSLTNGFIFVTGDKKFEKLKGVEFKKS